MFANRTLVEFLDALASRTPTPGGGSAGALAGALGASLGLMALRYSNWDRAEESAERLERVRTTLTALIDEDAAAYDGVTAARKLPRGTEEERTARSAAIQAALGRAAAVPFRGLEQVALGVEALALLKPHCNPNLVSDFLSSVQLFRAAARILALNVVVNLESMKNPGTLKERLAAFEREIESACANLEKAKSA